MRFRRFIACKVHINDKHIEVIVRQMLQKIEITDPGDSYFLKEEQIDKQEFEELNAKLKIRAKTLRLERQFFSVSPKRRCRHAHSSLRLRSRKLRACSQKQPLMAKSIISTA